MILGAMRRYVFTQANRAVWNVRHNERTNWDHIAKESVKRLLNAPDPEVDDDNAYHKNKTFTHQLYKWLISEMIGDAKVDPHSFPYYALQALTTSILSSQDYSSSQPVELDCPVGCEKPWDLYLYLFLASMILTVLLGGSLAVFVFALDRREAKAVALEAKEYGDNAFAVVVIDEAPSIEAKAPPDGSTSPERSSGERQSKRVKRSFYTRKQRKLSMAAASSAASFGSSSSTAAVDKTARVRM